MMNQKSVTRLLSLVSLAAVASAMPTSLAQVDNIVEVPTTRTTISQPAPVEDLTLGREYKSSKEVQTAQQLEPFWTWYTDAGYTTEYNFRGTNLTPRSDGDGFVTAEVSKWNFTLGLYGIHQFGSGRVNAFSVGEGGGGGSVGNLGFATFGGGNFVFGQERITPTTIQSRFNELDIYLQYHLHLGPVDLTVGNIGFFIQRDAQTELKIRGFVFVNNVIFDIRQSPTIATVEDERFDRVFLQLSVPRLIPHIVPRITYYQTIYNEGQDPLAKGGFPERNDSLGGYLEASVSGNFAVGERVSINPYAKLSYSFHDRSEPYDGNVGLKRAVRTQSLVGFNNAQVGLETPILLWHGTGSSGPDFAPPDPMLRLVPFVAYSYHISDPTPGTDRNEVWGGAKFVLTF